MKFIARPIAEPAIESLYRSCVVQARQPTFYADWHVQDSVDGRFDLLILHVLLVIQRLQGHSAETQQLFDILFADMDKNLREMGVSDMSIAKKMKPMLAAFYGRAKAYELALAAADGMALAHALRRNIFGNVAASPEDVRRLTDYVRNTSRTLADQDTAVLLTGAVSFPPFS
jgi:cytochrome b pre-mRNA-processing protein 3